jgi:endonuclease/exonuclease/phosphatase family metal-dependent hydrolase
MVSVRPSDSFIPRDNEGLESSIREFRGPNDPSRLVIGSYNIRYGVGQFLISTGLLRKAGLNLPRRRTEVVAQHIKQAASTFASDSLCPSLDVLAVQEADKGTERAGGHHVARELADALEMSWVHAAAGIPRGIRPQPRQWWLDFEEQIGLNDSGDTGVAILSHVSFKDVTRIDLPWEECPWRPRLSLGATVQLGGTDVRLLNSHIDPHPAISGQLEQLEVVLAEADKANIPVVLLGDFNTLSREKCVDTRRLIESRGFSTPFPTGTPTWRGAGIRLHADWIFVRGLTVLRCGVVRPLNSSDHWPIWAEVTIL